MKATLTVERAKALLSLDANGCLYWLGRGHGRRRGSRAGSTNRDGYRRVVVDGVAYAEHRVVWLIAYGEWPVLQIDHINGNRADNRLCNLRQATPSQNSCNRRGVAGVTMHKCGKYQAAIKHHGRSYYLGLFGSRADAELAYRRASAKLHGEFGVTA